MELGKFLISYILMGYENEEKLFEQKDNWYKYLFNIMAQNCKFDELIQNQVSFITFNYDRSLEMFLSNSIYTGIVDALHVIAK